MKMIGLVGIMLTIGRMTLAEDICEERVALKGLKDFTPLENNTELVRLDVTNFVEAYTNIANYVSSASKIMEGHEVTLTAGQSRCDDMYFWPDKYICLMGVAYDVNQAAWECDRIKYSLYNPLNRQADIDMFKKLDRKGIKYVPAILDASGTSLVNQEDEFVVPLSEEVTNSSILDEIDSYPVIITLNETNSGHQLMANLAKGVMPEDGSRVLCESEPRFYEKNNPIQFAFKHTLEEFLEKAPDLIAELKTQYQVANLTEKFEAGHRTLELRLNGVIRMVLESTFLMSGTRNWRKQEIASSVYPTLGNFEKLPLSKDGVWYKIDAKDVKGIRAIFNLRDKDFMDPELLFKVERVAIESHKRYAYGKITARLASAEKVLKQYDLMPYNEYGRIVNEKYMYKWNEDYFVSGINVEYDRGCSHQACDLSKFLETRNDKDKSCANYLMKKGGRESSCSYREHPWPVSYRLVCNENVTSVVSAPEEVTMNVDCGGIDSRDVLFAKGQTFFNSVCRVVLKGITLLRLEPNGPRLIPDSYIDPDSGNYINHLLYVGMGLLFAIAFFVVYSVARLFRGLPFCCCVGCCGTRCQRTPIPTQEEDCRDNLSLTSYTSKRTMMPMVKTTMGQQLPNAPPLNLLEGRQWAEGAGPPIGIGAGSKRGAGTTRDVMSTPEISQPGMNGGRRSDGGSFHGYPNASGSQYHFDNVDSTSML